LRSKDGEEKVTNFEGFFFFVSFVIEILSTLYTSKQVEEGWIVDEKKDMFLGDEEIEQCTREYSSGKVLGKSALDGGPSSWQTLLLAVG
jgi:hypothetical protein